MLGEDRHVIEGVETVLRHREREADAAEGAIQDPRARHARDERCERGVRERKRVGLPGAQHFQRFVDRADRVDPRIPELAARAAVGRGSLDRDHADTTEVHVADRFDPGAIRHHVGAPVDEIIGAEVDPPPAPLVGRHDRGIDLAAEQQLGKLQRARSNLELDRHREPACELAREIHGNALGLPIGILHHEEFGALGAGDDAEAKLAGGRELGARRLARCRVGRGAGAKRQDCNDP